MHVYLHHQLSLNSLLIKVLLLYKMSHLHNYKAKGFAVKYLWKRHKSSDLIGHRSDLTVYNATPLHEDQYYCIATDRKRKGYVYTFSHNATLKVNGKNKIILISVLLVES